jgi:glycosyltransferase involved in cell wall biosynthesis
VTGQLSTAAVIPTHLRVDLLLEAIASARPQVDQVFVVDDASDLATRAAVEQVNTEPGAPVTYVDNATGSGASSSRNLGAEHATTELVAFLDDDDLWRDGFVAAAEAALLAEGTDVAFVQLDQFLSAGRPLPRGLTSADVLSTNPGVSGSSILMRRSAFLALGGFDSRMWVSNDKDFLVRLLDAGYAYAVVPEPLVHWRHHEDSRLTKPSPRRIAGLQAYYDTYEARLTARDRRKLRGILEHDQFRMGGPLPSRALHLVRGVALLGPGMYVSRLRRRLRR